MTRDVLDRLRDADPVRDIDLPHASDADVLLLRDRVMAGVATPIARARRRRRRVAGVVAAALATAAAAAIAVSTSRVTDPTALGCFDAPSTTANTTVLSASGASPVDQCRQLWRDGDMDPEVTSDAQVPPLVACVLDTEGVVGVFPAGSCDEVDAGGGPDAKALPSSPVSPDDASGLSMPDYRTDDEDVRQALEEIRLALLDRCVGLETAIELAETALDRHGLEGWTVGPLFDDGSDGDTCAGFFPDATEHAVWFTPEEPAPGQTPESR